MKKIILGIVILSSAIINLSCMYYSPSGESDDSMPIPPVNFDSLEAKLKRAQLYCENPGECPKNVGMIFSNMQQNEISPKIGQCTGFLIAEDIVATNSHCVPDYLMSDVPCEKYMGIKFLDMYGTESVFTCRQLLDKSKIGIYSADYAFFRVQNTKRKPIQINKKGLKDNQQVQIVRVTPLSSTYNLGGKMEMRQCQVALGSLLNLKSTNAWSETGVALGCEIHGGNSGSPVLNSEGEAIGLLNAKMLEVYNTMIQAAFSSVKVAMPDFIHKNFTFSNFSCFPDPVTQFYEKEKCSEAENITIEDCTDFNNEKSKANLQKAYKSWGDVLPEIFIYEYLLDEKNNKRIALPLCVKSKEQYSKYSQIVKSEGIWGFKKETISLNYPYSTQIIPKFTIDNYYRLEPEIQYSEGSRTNVEVELTKNQDKWIGFYYERLWERNFNSWAEVVSNFGLMGRKIELSLPECTLDQINSEWVEKILTSSGEELAADEYNKKNFKEKKVCEK